MLKILGGVFLVIIVVGMVIAKITHRDFGEFVRNSDYLGDSIILGIIIVILVLVFSPKD